jgi:hypothetical protein
MKTMKIYMAGLFLFIGLSGIYRSVNAQDIKLSREERKEVRKAQLQANFAILDSLLNAKSFVLEADYLQNKYGYRILVVPSLNFIKVNRANGILQTGSNTGIGYNSVGGVTAEGNIGAYKIYKDFRKLSYTLEFSLLTNIGHYDITMYISADNYATATISGLGPGKLTWEGHLATLDNSRVFKGQNTI